MPRRLVVPAIAGGLIALGFGYPIAREVAHPQRTGGVWLLLAAVTIACGVAAGGLIWRQALLRVVRSRSLLAGIFATIADAGLVAAPIAYVTATYPAQADISPMTIAVANAGPVVVAWILLFLVSRAVLRQTGSPSQGGPTSESPEGRPAVIRMRHSHLGIWSLAIALLPYAALLAFGAIAMMIINGSAGLAPPRTPPNPEGLSQWRTAAIVAFAGLVLIAIASVITGGLSLRWYRSLAGGIGLILGAAFLVLAAAPLVPALWQLLTRVPLNSTAADLVAILVPNVVLVAIVVAIGLMVWRLGRERL